MYYTISGGEGGVVDTEATVTATDVGCELHEHCTATACDVAREVTST